MAATPLNPDAPVVAGYGVDTFQVGGLLYQTDFSDVDQWVLQMQPQPESELVPRTSLEDGVLDIYAPGRGCTAWLNRPFTGPIVITYKVLCPLDTLGDEGIQARDLNNFWHATDPGRAAGIFDAQHYTGSFVTYHEMRGYYASSGGGGATGNKTTRFRRYPRWIEGADVPHLALNEQDGNPEFLIVPGQWHTIQLVAFNGLVQYLFDGKVVYEIKEGDTVVVEDRDKSTPAATSVSYTLDAFPAYTQGYFGFRMVASHHQYADLKVHRLVPHADR